MDTIERLKKTNSIIIRVYHPATTMCKLVTIFCILNSINPFIKCRLGSISCLKLGPLYTLWVKANVPWGWKKKDTMEFGKANLQPLGANVPSFISQFANPWGPMFHHLLIPWVQCSSIYWLCLPRQEGYCV